MKILSGSLVALNSTIFKAELQVTDTDRDYYETHKLTLARHPSETDERMMVRLLVFALHADPALEMVGAISSEDTPAIWRKNRSDEILEWIEIGQPDEKRIRKACARAKHVFVYCFGQHRAKPWYKGIQRDLERFDNLTVKFLADEPLQAITSFAERTMQLLCTIQDNEIRFSNDKNEHLVECETWRMPVASRRLATEL